MIKFPFEKTSDDMDEFKKELEKFILRTIPESPTYIENCSRSINSMYCNESKEYKGIYSKAKMGDLRKIEKKLNKLHQQTVTHQKNSNKTQLLISSLERRQHHELEKHQVNHQFLIRV